MGPFISLTQNWHLIQQMTRREIEAKYKGSLFGLLWSLITPLIMLAVYSFVFGVIFKSRWGLSTGEETNYTLALFIGLISHSFIAETINSSPSLMKGNVNYIKKVIFPIQVLPWISLFTNLFHFIISFCIWCILSLIITHQFQLTSLYTPLIFLPLILFTIGFSWFLSSLGVFIKDVSQIVTLLTTILLFLSPVFYPVSLLPASMQTIMHFNPLAITIEQLRTVLIAGELPNFTILSIEIIASYLTALIGYIWFEKTKRGFSDVL